ncbi:MAG TPA: hypothetical protein VGN20_15640 [Mucilaginibacter sp.]|jgi:hypothetical protein
MKNFKYLVIALGLLVSSCAAPISYLGEKYPATTAVDVFYSAHDVKREYKVIGHLSFEDTGKNDLTARFTGYAKAVGADAIVISSISAAKDNNATVINIDALKYLN